MEICYPRRSRSRAGGEEESIRMGDDFVADIEHKNQTNSNVKSIANAFCEELRAQGVKKVGLYIGQYFYPYILH